MPIRITVLIGDADDLVVVFQDHVEVINIARAKRADISVTGDEADVKRAIEFASDQTSISRTHLTIRRRNRRYFLELGNAYVFVNGEEAHEGDPLPKHAVIALGLKTGQQLKVDWWGDEESSMTEPGVRRKRVSASRAVAEASQRTRSDLVRIAAAGGVVLLIAVIGGYFLLQERQSQLAARIEQQTAKRPDKSERIAAQLQKAAVSVYLVLLRGKSGERALGTAWVVAPDTLATNVHIAEIYQDLKPRLKLMTKVIVRSNEPPYRSFEVASVKLHPDYQRFDKTVERYAPSVHGKLVSFGGAYDVALLRVKAGKALAPPLKIASAPILKGLKAGDTIGYVGYPFELTHGAGINLKSPVPQTQIAHVTAVTDFFRSKKGDQKYRHLVQHALPAHGGASGSPILNQNGEVVAALSGGTLVTINRRRIATGIGVNFGQRADLVRELLNNRETKHAVARAARWQSRLREFKSLPEVRLAEFEVMTNMKDLRPVDKARGILRTGVVIKGRKQPVPSYVRSFVAPSAGFFHAQVHDEYGRGIGIKLVNADGKTVKLGNADQYFASVSDLVMEKGSITIVVSGRLVSRFRLRIFFVRWKDYQSRRKP